MWRKCIVFVGFDDGLFRQTLNPEIRSYSASFQRSEKTPLFLQFY